MLTEIYLLELSAVELTLVALTTLMLVKGVPLPYVDLLKRVFASSVGFNSFALLVDVNHAGTVGRALSAFGLVLCLLVLWVLHLIKPGRRRVRKLVGAKARELRDRLVRTLAALPGPRPLPATG